MTKIASCVLVLPLLIGARGFAQEPVKQKPTSRPASRPASEAPWVKDKSGKYQSFGAKLAKKAPPAYNAEELVSKLEELEGKTVRVTGTVDSTCAKKGCWMWVTHGKARVFVRFKDYGFFVPKKGAEKRPVVFEGKVSKKELSVEEARHYAEDAGDLEGAKKITEPQTIPFVMATGVKMYSKPEPEKKGAETDKQPASKKTKIG